MKRLAEELAARTGSWGTVMQAIVLQYMLQVQLGASSLKVAQQTSTILFVNGFLLQESGCTDRWMSEKQPAGCACLRRGLKSIHSKGCNEYASQESCGLCCSEGWTQMGRCMNEQVTSTRMKVSFKVHFKSFTNYEYCIIMKTQQDTSS